MCNTEVPQHFSLVTLIFDHFEFWDLCSDFGQHFLDALSFIQKYMCSIHCWSFGGFAYMSKQCPFSLMSMFWPFPGLLVPSMTSASNKHYRQPRPRVPRSKTDAVYVVNGVFVEDPFVPVDKISYMVPFSGTHNKIDTAIHIYIYIRWFLACWYG
jgi:hypothetical protein